MQSTSGRQHVKSTAGSEQGQMFQKCTALWRDAYFEVKTLKAQRARSTFGSQGVGMCTQLWHEERFEVKMPQALANTPCTGLNIFNI